MARFSVVALIIVISLLGSKVYRTMSSPKVQGSTVAKCVTKNGETYYGTLPEGVVCENTSQIEIQSSPTTPAASSRTNTPDTSSRSTTPAGGFRCDGRQHCSQMTSCAEAEFFLSHCPSTKMDGDGDRIPCERQWCK